MEWQEREGGRVLEADLPGALATFTTRLGGVSGGPFASLNLGLLTGDEPSHVRENRRRAALAAGVAPQSVLIGHQVHGAEITRREAAPRPNPYAEPASAPPKVDGQVTSTPGLAPAVLVADCLPVAVAGPAGIAMLHCGWRGLAAGIVDRGAQEVRATHAAIGPGIGPCCYEVGPEVLEAFARLGDGMADGRMLDLRAVASRLLEEAGVRAVEISELCTSCNAELFYSHRRDEGRTGRQAGLVRHAAAGRAG